MVAAFVRFYGAETYWSARWPTSDGVIPFPLFFLLFRAMTHVAGAEQFRSYHASALAFAQVMGGKDSQSPIRTAVQKLMQLAFPSEPRNDHG